MVDVEQKKIIARRFVGLKTRDYVETTVWGIPYDPNSRIIYIVVYSTCRGRLTKYIDAN